MKDNKLKSTRKSTKNRVELKSELIFDRPQSFWVCLPWPPSINESYHPRAGGGGVYKDPRARRWLATATAMIRCSDGYRFRLFPAGTRVRVSHALVPKTARGYDVDNRDKALYDALHHSGLLDDDVQIYAGDRVKYDKQEGGEHAGVYVLVERLPDDFGITFDLEDWMHRR